jgi:hypothetical protein
MPRIRSVKPEIAGDAKLAALPADVRWTFLLCITQADDVGLLPGKPRALLGILYPNSDDVTEAKLARWLRVLVDAGLLAELTTADGAPLLHLANWSRHQQVDKPHHSTLSRALVRDAAGHNSRMDREQFEKTLAAIRDSVAIHSRTVRNRIRDLGSGIRDQGSGTEDRAANSARAVAVLRSSPREEFGPLEVPA